MDPRSIQGGEGVRVDGAVDSTFNINFGKVAGAVPLERATVPVSADAKSPTALIRARSGVVPFAARKGLREELIGWMKGDAPFAGAVIGGAGGAGKTRLAVEICDWAEGEEWLSGILAPIEDLASLEALAEAALPRLIAVDYAESRAEQMRLLLPLLASRATPEAPVRVLLLVRASPKRTSDWAESLRNKSDLLDNLLDRCEMHVLEDLPLEAEERAELFEAAAAAFAGRNGTAVPPLPGALQESSAFASPLLVVLAAYLAVHGDEAPPDTRDELFRAVLLHEERYWRSSSGDLFADAVQPRQIVALATLLSVDSEAEAVERLRLLADFADAPTERLGPIARWAAKQHPGTGWWNPLEPDLVGEQLIADEFSEQPAVLAGALAGETPGQLVRPLEVFGRASANHPRLAAALQPILNSELQRLCRAAVDQAQNEADHDLLYGSAVTVAAVLEKAIGGIELDRSSLSGALAITPFGSNLVLNSLVLMLSIELVEHQRRLAETSPASQSDLASALNRLCVRLAYVGRRAEALTASEECVALYRRLVADDPGVYEPRLASALNNLCNRLAAVGRRPEALARSEECVEIRRRLVAGNPAAYESGLASGLNNLCNRLAAAGRRTEALAASEECVALYRRLAADGSGSDVYEPRLASAVNNLSNRLAAAGRRTEALARSEECVAIRRRLVAGNPAAYEPVLALALNNLSNRLAALDRDADGLAASEECVAIRRRLVAGNPAAYEPDLASGLNNLSNRLAAVDRDADGLAASEECVAIRRRLVAGNPAAYEPDLASGLNNLSNRLAALDRDADGLAASEECVAIRRRLVAGNPAAYEPDLALALNNLSVCLAHLDRRPEALARSEECVALHRRLSAAEPAAYESRLASALDTLSHRLGEMDRPEDARRAQQEATALRSKDEGTSTTPAAPE